MARYCAVAIILRNTQPPIHKGDGVFNDLQLQITKLWFGLGNSWSIEHFTVLCLVAWPLNESEAGVDIVLIETSLLFICKFLLISMRTASLT